MPRSAIMIATALFFAFGVSAGAMAADRANGDGFLYFRNLPDHVAPKPAKRAQKPVARKAVAPAKLKAIERGYAFTPASALSDPKGVNVGIVTRSTAESGLNFSESNSYGVGAGVGYRGFILDAQFGRAQDRPLSLTEGMNLGVSYKSENWRTTFRLAEENTIGRGTSAILNERKYSVDVGGAYHLTPSVSLSGGVKYSLSYQSDASRAAKGAEQTNSSVYLGTAIDF